MTTVALIGGNEFRRECDPVDRALLDLAGGAGTPVAILPTAATNENPYVAGENGVRHFRRLGAVADKFMIVDEATANDGRLATQLAHYRLIFLAGGDPVYLLETLRGSLAWQSIQYAHAGGALLAGSSAGAMALCGQMWHFDGWMPGLGLAPSLAVLPHHATLSARWDVGHMRATLPEGGTLVGIDDATALLLPDGRVLGAGEVTVYTPSGPRTYAAGEVAEWQGPLGGD